MATKNQVWAQVQERANALIEKSGSRLSKMEAVERVFQLDRSLEQAYLDADGDPLPAPVEVEEAEQPGDKEWAAIEKAARALVDTDTDYYKALDRVVDEQPALYRTYVAAAGGSLPPGLGGRLPLA